MTAKERLSKARIHLITHFPFWGRLSVLLAFQEEPQVGTAGTDGEKLFYNPAFIDTLTDPQVIGVFMHEIMHCALGHLWRRDNRMVHWFNIACDYAINPLILQEKYRLAGPGTSSFDLPNGVLYSEKFANMSAEEIYKKLPKKCLICQVLGQGESQNKVKNQDKDGQGSSESSSGNKKEKEGQGEKKEKEDQGKDGQGQPKPKGPQGKPQLGEGESGENEEQDFLEQKDGQTRSVRKKQGHTHSCQSHQFWGKAKKKGGQAVQNRWASAVEEAVKQKGSVPASFERQIAWTKSNIDWRQILASFLSSSSSDFDFMKRDRRTLQSPFYLPDLSNEENLENVVVAVDTSGSIGSVELNQFVSEVKQILGSFSQVRGWLIDCDAAVHGVWPLETVDKVTFHGGGGTSHVPVFQEIVKRDMKPKVLICFTDLYSDFPSEEPNYPVLWMTLGKNHADKPSFGRLVEIPDLGGKEE